MANSNINTLEQEHSSLTTELILLNNQQNVSEASIETLEQRIFQLEFALVENKSTKNSLQSQLDVVSNSLVEANQQIIDLTNELLLANTAITTLQEQIAELNAQLNGPPMTMIIPRMTPTMSSILGIVLVDHLPVRWRTLPQWLELTTINRLFSAEEIPAHQKSCGRM